MTRNDSRDRLGRLLGVAVLIILAAALAVKHARKVSQGRGAFVRWVPQIQALVRGQDVYDVAPPEASEEDETDLAYPNPPLLAICLYPLTLLGPTAGAMTLFAIKSAMVWFIVWWAVQLASGADRLMPPWAVAIVLVLSARPIISDLEHGNVNIIIAFLVMAGLWSFARGRDLAAGLLIALAVAFKVTPALLIPYFAWKRQWRVVGWSLLGLILFLLILPAFVLGPRGNWQMLMSWKNAMIVPYAVRGHVETLQHNQSVPGLVHRLLTDSDGVELRGGKTDRVNVASLDRRAAGGIVKILSALIVLWLMWICRTKTSDRRDWRLACEYALVLIAMLLISERSWKHHYVTMVLPFAAAVAVIALHARDTRWRRAMIITLIAAFVLMASTSRELGGWMADAKAGHKYAQAYGMFMFAAVAIFVALSAVLLKWRHSSAPSDAPVSIS